MTPLSINTKRLTDMNKKIKLLHPAKFPLAELYEDVSRISYAEFLLAFNKIKARRKITGVKWHEAVALALSSLYTDDEYLCEASFKFATLERLDILKAQNEASAFFFEAVWDDVLATLSIDVKDEERAYVEASKGLSRTFKMEVEELSLG